MSAEVAKVNAVSNGQLLTLTREMLASAEASDWERLAYLERTRLPLFQQVFAQGISGKVELAREILMIDEKTKSLAEAGMPALQDEILIMNNSGKANNAYQTVQGFTSGNE